MNVQVKHARFNLLVCGVTFFLTAAAYLLLLHLIGPRGSSGAFGFLGLLGLLGFAPLFYRKKPGAPGVLMDERDVQIRVRVDSIAWCVVWLYWGVVCMGIWFAVVLWRGLEAIETTAVPVFWFPLMYGGGFVVYVIIWSVAILAQYGISDDTHED
jgi:hypothetical protein